MLLETILRHPELVVEISIFFNYLFDQGYCPLTLLPKLPAVTAEQVKLFRFFQDYCENDPKSLQVSTELLDLLFLESQDPFSLAIQESLLAALAALSGRETFDRGLIASHASFIELVIREFLKPQAPRRFGVRCHAIRLLGNCSYQIRSIQDRIRLAGGIECILNHTNIDESQPFQREWSIIAIRNVCENNVENQVKKESGIFEGFYESYRIIFRI